MSIPSTSNKILERRWLENNYAVDLFQNFIPSETPPEVKTHLQCEVTDLATEALLSITKLNTGPQSSHEAIIALKKKYYPVLDEQKIPTFEGYEWADEWSCYVIPKNSPNTKITLAWRNAALVWRFFDKTIKTESWIYADREKDGLEEYLTGASQKKGGALEEHLRNAEITVITDPKFGHAMIFYEGVKDGVQFLKFAHLTTIDEKKEYAQPGSVELEITLETKVRYRAKTPTWLRTRAQVERMIEKINTQISTKFFFNETGNRYLGMKFLKFLGKQIAKASERIFFATPQDYENQRMSSSNSYEIKNDIEYFFKGPLQKNTQPGLQPSYLVESARAAMLLFAPFTIVAISQNLIAWGEKFAELVKTNKTYFERKRWEYNCLTWAIPIVEETGISLPPIKGPIAIPDLYVQSIAKNPSLVKLK